MRSAKSGAKASEVLNSAVTHFFLFFCSCNLIVLVCPSVQVLVQLLQRHHRQMSHAKLLTTDGWSWENTVLSLKMTLFLLSVTFPECSATEVRGVCRRQWSLHQVSDGARPGLDHLLRRWGKLQGGCEEGSLFLLLLINSCADSKHSLFLFFFLLLPTADWLGWASGELCHLLTTSQSLACVDKRLLHPKVFLWRPLWLCTLVWLQQKVV